MPSFRASICIKESYGFEVAVESRLQKIVRQAFAVIGMLLSPATLFAVDYNQDIRPILASKCFACHGPDKASRKADLRLDERDAALSVLSPADPQSSELLARIANHDPDIVMPPPETKKAISPDELLMLRQWIADGASYSEHWAFVPPKKPTMPQVENRKWVRNAIDLFILSRLESEEISPSETANRRTLIRRVSLDITGLPPTPSEIAQFESDSSANAYEKLIDRLLDSPRYGEQMALFWLEAARYADTDGYQNDRYRYMSPWRDWVISAFNANQPYNDFVIDQLAGDMLPNATLRQQVATGFCRNHRINSEDGSIPAEWHVENVVDRVDTLGTVFLGLTIGCARCHDHKYDPISQKEYYQLFAYFNNVPEWGIGPNNGNSPPFITVPTNWPNLSASEDKAVTPEPLALQPARKNEDGNGLKRPQPGDPTTTMVMQEMATPRPTYVLTRGQYNLPIKNDPLEAGVPEKLHVRPNGQQPNDRLELARWLVSDQNPLVARVAVNRLWQQFFGTGIVKTSENFGTQGEPPSHPDLLDWLAIEFIDSGWNVKRLQKLILMSSTYRQTSRFSAKGRAIDPENRLLARGARFRLPAFTLRDQALFTSGLLFEKVGGPSVKPYMPPKIWSSISNNRYKQDHGAGLYRRGLYTYWRRTIPPPTMVNFNAAEREVCIVRKDKTNTPLQALTLMNNVVFVEASRSLAERMLKFGSDNIRSQIMHGFELTTGRNPSPQELDSLVRSFHAILAEIDEESALQLLSVGEKERDPSLDSKAHASMTMIASTLLNLDETITRE